MEKCIEFDQYLFGENECDTYEIHDLDFWVDRIVIYPSLRPLNLDKVVRLCVEYCKDQNFRKSLIRKSLCCPVLIYRLYKMGIFVMDDIRPMLIRQDAFIYCYYFKKYIKDFDFLMRKKTLPKEYGNDYFNNDNNVEEMIEYGFLKSSIEYCLKYDDIDVIRNLEICDNKEAKWSPFEWSKKPRILDLLSLSGFFGSIKCFKYLLANGYYIDDKVRSAVVCSGSSDLFHLCNGDMFFSEELIANTIVFSRLLFLQFLIENGVNRDIKINHKTPLHISTLYGHISIVRYLVEHGCDMNSKDKQFRTALHYSSFKGHLNVVEYLVEHGCDMNSKDRQDQTPLHHSSSQGHLNVVKYLVEHGCDIGAYDMRHQLSVELATKSGHDNVVKYLKTIHDIYLKAFIDSKNGILESIIELHHDHLNLDTRDNDFRTLLHYSSSYGHLNVVEYLVEHGCDINSKDIQDQTPLHYSSSKGHLNVVEYLVEHGCEMNSEDKQNRTALHYSSSNGRVSVCKYLVEHGCDINSKDQQSQTALHYSSSKGHLSVCKYLVEHGCDINSKDQQSQTALHYSLINGHFNVVEYLFKHGCDIKSKDKENGTTLHHSSSNGHDRICKFLIEHGCDVGDKTMPGYSSIKSWDTKSMNNGPINFSSPIGHQGWGMQSIIQTNNIINPENHQERTSLQFSSANGQQGFAKYNSNHKWNINSNNTPKKIPLELVMENQKAEDIEFLKKEKESWKFLE